MLRTSFLKKYIHVDSKKIHHTIYHHFTVFLPLLFRNIFFLLILYVFYYFLNLYTAFDSLETLFALIGALLLGKFVIDFLNLYLDSLVLTDEGLILFLREGVLENRVEIFDRSRIETISYSQKGLSHRVLLAGDIEILLDDGIQFPFEDVARPKKHIEKILQIKDKYITHKGDGKFEDERMTIFIEAMSDVVKEYVGKNKDDVE